MDWAQLLVFMKSTPGRDNQFINHNLSKAHGYDTFHEMEKSWVEKSLLPLYRISWIFEPEFAEI